MTHATIMWKDSLFAVSMLVLVLKLFDCSKKNHIAIKEIVSIVTLCLLISLLRNNGIYISVITLIFIFFCFAENRKAIAIGSVSLLLIIGLIQGPGFALLSVSKGHFAETVAVPLQQIAAIEAENGHSTSEQQSFIDNILPVNEMSSAYNPISVNQIKFAPNFNDSYLENHKLEFFSVWAEMVLNNPGIAFKAWVNLTKGYWQIGYEGADIGSYTTLYEGQPISLIKISLNPTLLVRAIKEIIPFAFSMGSAVWFMLVAFGISIFRYKGNQLIKRVICFVPLLALLLSLLVAAPIVSDFRYILAIYLAIPFFPILGSMFGIAEKTSA